MERSEANKGQEIEDQEFHHLAKALRIVVNTLPRSESLYVFSTYNNKPPIEFKVLMALLNKNQRKLISHTLTSLRFAMARIKDPTIEDVLALDPEKLENFPGVGKKRAAFIREVFFPIDNKTA